MVFGQRSAPSTPGECLRRIDFNDIRAGRGRRSYGDDCFCANCHSQDEGLRGRGLIYAADCGERENWRLDDDVRVDDLRRFDSFSFSLLPFPPFLGIK